MKSGWFLKICLLLIPGATGFALSLTDYSPQNGPGTVALIAKRGQIQFHKATGYANVEKKVKLTTTSQFNLASVSKHMTAMAILQLIENGKISENSKLSDLLPGLPGYTRNIQLHHLVRHTSGLPNYEDICEESSRPLSNADVTDFIKKTTKPDFSAGSKFAYSNTGYVLLAEIIAAKSGLAFDIYMQKFLFNKAGMKNTYVITPARRNMYLKNSVRAYAEDWQQGKWEEDPCDYISGDGGIVSTTGDMHAWFSALTSNKLASASMMKKYFTSRIVNDEVYAFGLSGNEDDESTFDHSGSWNGYATYVTLDIENRNWQIWLSNWESFPYGDSSEAAAEEFF